MLNCPIYVRFTLLQLILAIIDFISLLKVINQNYLVTAIWVGQELKIIWPLHSVFERILVGIIKTIFFFVLVLAGGLKTLVVRRLLVSALALLVLSSQKTHA